MNLNVPFFIAKRLAINKKQSFSAFIIKLSIAATALSVAAMIITSAFVNGFQDTVAKKVFSFWGHLRVQYYETSKAFISEENPIPKSMEVENILKKNNQVKHIQPFATKSGVLEKNRNIEGILFKGIDETYDSSTIKPFILQGNWLNFKDSLYSKDIMISSILANELNIKLYDTVNVFFVSANEGESIYRPVIVKCIYKTGIEEYDKIFVVGDIKLIRRLSNWNEDEIGGYEVILKDYQQMNAVNNNLDLPVIWNSKTIQQIYPNIFEWLQIQDLNKNVMFIIMSIVAIINLITCLLILVLERIKMIGILKAVGYSNSSIQKIFLYHASIIAFIGIIIGCFVGIGLCLLQQYTSFITLDESNYYVSVAPVKIIWGQVFAICGAVLVICFASLSLPVILVKKINPLQAIQFR
ncbi:MAG TPA: FtsX-like permease family protein [Chitinophagaceae bacterium]|nr:FtsX-like permease family protein [Chitinophagaceae bacterium]MCC6635225.1 ABC transporter permease [Chitinophagaceae bacterium]HMZ45559.1 FtsX-like permease family protein [Chitinophagaceae bacterium]HNE93022.1 FtsX-like permease family protein [Chitinophagaceae bacterium]HNF29149.1 FtsX-like permease family protein [Chitinophagaceae bacterium]